MSIHEDFLQVTKREKELRQGLRLRCQPAVSLGHLRRGRRIQALSTIATIINKEVISNGLFADNPSRILQCNHLCSIIALVTKTLGLDPAIYEGLCDGFPHAWVVIEGVCIDLAGAQFGLPEVQVWAEGTNTRYGGVFQSVSGDLLYHFHSEPFDPIVHRSLDRAISKVAALRRRVRRT